MYASALTALALAVGAPGAKDPPKKEALVVGEWAIESAVIGGRREDPPAGTTWEFTADGKSVLSLPGGKDAASGTFTTDTKKDPAWVDISAGPKGIPMKGIFKKDGEKLILCLGTDRDTRPEAFESKEGEKIILLTLTKAKKE